MKNARRSSRNRVTTVAISALAIALTPGLTALAGPNKAGQTSTESATPASPPSAIAPVDSTPGETTLVEVVDQIGADDMWAAGYTGDGVDVAVIDTGIAPITEFSTTDVFVGPDLSFEGNIDAVAGLDTYGHGTHMAGIIAGRTPDADPLHPRAGDFIGVAPDARIVSVKVADNTGAVDVSQVIAAIDWVVQNRTTNGLNIRVLNLSYNTNGTQSAVLDPLSKAVENAWRHGIVVVVSAGNEGRGAKELASPATNPYVIAVQAAEWEDGGEWIIPSVGFTGPSAESRRVGTGGLDPEPACPRLTHRHPTPRRPSRRRPTTVPRLRHLPSRRCRVGRRRPPDRTTTRPDPRPGQASPQ